MDENEFHIVRESVTECKCRFDKAILTTRYCCLQAKKINIGEREAVTCSVEGEAQLCARFLNQVTAHATFALGQTSAGGKLTHAKDIKLQCGTINGLLKLFNTTSSSDNCDITTLIHQAYSEYDHFESVPYSDLIRYIADWKQRKRAKKKNNQS